MDSPQDFKSLQENVQKALVSAVKSVNRVSNHDLGFQRVADPDVDERIQETTSRILKLTTQLLKVSTQTSRVHAPKLEDVEDVDLSWRSIVDVLDSNFEKIDVALDEFAGVVKQKALPANRAENNAPAKKTKSASALDPGHRNANIPKPQLKFEIEVDNFPRGPWKPLLSQKPHACLPLDQSLISVEGTSEDDTKEYKHPYEAEILMMKYPDSVYQSADPIMYHPIDSTAAKWVGSFDDVKAMLSDLKKAKEIAIDLEHHDYRTYTGLTCLMQISTRDQDWIVDTLQPWRQKLEILNEVFANPDIVKVLHGAYMDVIWLQRDLGLYLVGYFDTGIAAEVLGYPHRSLAFLLKKFVNFDADKKYQLADWRIRPLPEEMFFYARSDTHFLLYIYDMMRNELVQKSRRERPETDFIERALQKSRQQALDRYEHATFDESNGQGPRGWYNYIVKHPSRLSGEQFAVFRAVWRWRDTVARKADESVQYILPSQNVMDIAQVLPPDLKALYSLLPKYVGVAKALASDLWEVVQSARAAGRSAPTMHQFLTAGAKVTPTDVPEGKTANGTPIDPDGAVKASRLEQSQLFGNIPISTLWEENLPARPKMDDYIPFPWQTLPEAPRSYKTFQTEAPLPDLVTLNQAAAAEIIPLDQTPSRRKPSNEEDVEFTLKAGTKRKLEVENEVDEDAEDGEIVDEETGSEAEVEDGSSSPLTPAKTPAAGADADEDADVDEVMDLDADGTVMTEAEKDAEIKKRKIEKKMRRKAHKRAKFAARKRANQQVDSPLAPTEPGQQATPFDYSQAASVLHSKRGQGGIPTGPKAFDPYSKAGIDGPKGARKAPPLAGGRSATFKK